MSEYDKQQQQVKTALCIVQICILFRIRYFIILIYRFMDLETEIKKFYKCS